MADHSKPTVTSTYANYTSELDGRLDDLARGLDPATTTPTNVPTNAIRWASASNKWEKWNGTAWSDLSSNYVFTDVSVDSLGVAKSSPIDTLDVAGGITISAADGLDVTGTDSTTSQVPLAFYRGGTGDKTGTACRIRTVGDGTNNAVQMIFDTADTERLRITSTGIDVTGTVVSDGLTVDNISVDGNTISSTTGSLLLDAAGTFILDTASVERFRVASNGDISFYEDTGTTAKFFWDASAESLGIGTSSPGATLDVAGDAKLLNGLNVGTTGLFTAASPQVQLGQSGVGMFRPASDVVAFATNDTERLRLDSAGNLGLGVTPSAWDTVAFDLQNRTGIWETSNGSSIWANNTYYDAGFKYKETGVAAYYAQSYTGGHIWYTAPSGTAGTAISFTQAMTLDASKNLGIGTSAPLNRLHVAGESIDTNAADGTGVFRLQGAASTYSGLIGFDASTMSIGTSNASRGLSFAAGGAERARFTSDGAFLVGKSGSSLNNTGFQFNNGGYLAITVDGNSTLALNRQTSNGNVAQFYRGTTSSLGSVVGSISVTTTSTAYNTSSDYRLKEDWQPMTGASERVKALKPVNFAWKASGERVDGFLAHEAQAVVPESVTGTKDAVDAEGNPEYQGIDQSKLVPLLTAALQEALAQIESLTARVSALEGN